MKFLTKYGAWILALGYFTYYGFISLEFTYLPTYLLEILKFDGQDLGIIYFGIPLIGIFSQPFWGQMADSTQKTGMIIRLCTFLGLLGCLPLLFYKTFFSIAACVWMISFFMSPISSLLDTVVLTRFGMKKYAHIRVWGSVGYGFFAFVFPSKAILAIVPAIIFSLAFCWIVSLLLGEEEGRPKSTVKRFYFLSLLSTPAFLFLIAFSFFHWSSNIPYHMILDVYQRNMFWQANATGYAIAVGIIAECIVMSTASKWLPKASPRFWLILAASITAVRWACMSHPLSKPVFIFLQAAHCFSFAVFFLASVSYLVSFVPQQMRASSQALFAGFTFAGGQIFGSLYTGFLLDLPGKGFLVFGTAAIISIFSLIIALLIGIPSQMIENKDGSNHEKQ